MIEIAFGKLGKARIVDRTWSSDVESLRRMLQVETDALFIHGGIPDAEEFIVNEISKAFIAESPPNEFNESQGRKDPWKPAARSLITIVRKTERKSDDTGEAGDLVVY